MLARVADGEAQAVRAEDLYDNLPIQLPPHRDARMADLLIRHATAVTMDPARRVMEDAAIAVASDRIVAVGPDAEIAVAHAAAEEIEARGMAAIPGLIDCHSHAGHGLVRSLERFPIQK